MHISIILPHSHTITSAHSHDNIDTDVTRESRTSV